MKYTVSKSIVRIIGSIWEPGSKCTLEITLKPSDVEDAKDDNGNITRESLERWVLTHSGDFSSVDDLYGSIEVGDQTVEIPWKDEESEAAYMVSVFGVGV